MPPRDLASGQLVMVIGLSGVCNHTSDNDDRVAGVRFVYHVITDRIGRHEVLLPINYKQLLDEVFVISRIIKVEVRVISRSRRLRLITLTETLIILDITKTESNNCFIIH